MRHYYGSISGERQAWELGSLPTGYGGASLLSVAAPFLLAGGRSLPRIRLVLPPSLSVGAACPRSDERAFLPLPVGLAELLPARGRSQLGRGQKNIHRVHDMWGELCG